jgi:anthranilate phosphoribosyltransferase
MRQAVTVDGERRAEEVRERRVARKARRAEQGASGVVAAYVAAAQGTAARARAFEGLDDWPLVGVAVGSQPGWTPVCAVAGVLAAAADACVVVQSPWDGHARAVARALGLAHQTSSRDAEAAVREVGFALLDARAWHPHGERAAEVALALANPARPDGLVIGAPSPQDAFALARAADRLGVSRGLFVTCGDVDGIGVLHATTGWSLEAGRTRPFTLPPVVVVPDALRAGTAEGDASRLRDALERPVAGDPLGEWIARNAAAALWIAGVMPSWSEALGWARERLAQGVDLAPFRVASAGATEL